MIRRIRLALFRLRCTLEDPASWVGFAIDPAVTDRLTLWLYLGPSRQVFWSPWWKWEILRHYNQNECPGCDRIHFPWCPPYGGRG